MFLRHQDPLLNSVLLDSRLLRRMYPNRRFLLRPAQDHLLLAGEWQHPLTRLRRQRLRPRNHRHHVRLLHLEGEDRPHAAEARRPASRFCLTPDLPSLVLHHQGEPGQRGHVCRRVALAGERSQPPHHHRHVAVPCVQRQPVPRRRAGAHAALLHSRRHHHLHPGHGGSHGVVCQERQGLAV